MRLIFYVLQSSKYDAVLTRSFSNITFMEKILVHFIFGDFLRSLIPVGGATETLSAADYIVDCSGCQYAPIPDVKAYSCNVRCETKGKYKYRSGTVNSKSFVGKVLLRIKWKFELN